MAFAYGFYFLVFAVPTFGDPLTLDVSNQAMIRFGITAGLLGMALVEATWWITAAIRRERPRLWGLPAPVEEVS